MPWSVLGTKCAYGDEGEMRGNVRTFMMQSCYTAGSTHLSQVYVHDICNILYGIIYSIPVHDIPGIETVYMCMHDVQQREICERIVTVLQQ